MRSVASGGVVMASRREVLFLNLFRYCWFVHGQAPQSQALSQRLAWGLLSGGFESGDCCGLYLAFGNCCAGWAVDDAYLPASGATSIEQFFS